MWDPWQSFAASAFAAVAAVLLLAFAARFHRRRVARIPVRVHVAGSRGKTGTARLIGAGLAAGGMKVFVRTTGTEPILIFPDGAEEPWPRSGAPSISELRHLIKVVAGAGADALVIESMGIEPEYLWASERYLVHATHLVVTNLRPDHEEVYREGAGAMAENVGALMPQGGRAYLTPESDRPEFHALCRAHGSAATVVEAASGDPLETNRRLALALCRDLGVPEAEAVPAMAAAGEDAGAFFIAWVGAPPDAWRFANAFACNDAVSRGKLWSAHPSPASPVVLLNARADRPLRSRAFLAALARLEPSVRLVLHGRVPRRWVRAAGFPQSRVTRLHSTSAREALSELGALAGPDGMVWGVGNYAGLGARIAKFLRASRAPC